MTGIRQSILFRIEDSFAEDPYPTMPDSNGRIVDDDKKWTLAPPGTYFQNTHTRSSSKIYGTGSKFYELASYGSINGSWEWTFPLTYEYLEPLLLVFEQYTATSVGEGATNHVFKKSNSKRVVSFAIRRKILNEIAGGPEGSDELDYVMGCVVKSIRITRSSGTSQASVTLSGVYSKDKIVTGHLDSTDYVSRDDGNMVEFGCLLYSNMPTLAEVKSDGYVKPDVVPYVDSLTVALDNGVNMLFATCTPFATGYYEGRSTFNFGMTTYANDPNRVKRRTYTGGYAPQNGFPVSAKTRMLKPLEVATVFSFNSNDEKLVENGTGMTDPGAEVGGYKDPIYRYLDSDRSAKFVIKDTIVKSIAWSKGEGGRLMDQMSSAECKDIEFMFKTGIGDYRNSHKYQTKGA